ncbi:MAG TPA: CoA pyrophosphatase [Chloroflexota bacterium]|nr:CoA pyrophosphatase [Chloroflexota bacterium]
MEASPPRIAAVLILQFEREGNSHIVLTKRTDDVANHKGQISLPGGAREPEDETLLDTALRETEEELGISPDRIEVIGQLKPVYTSASNFNIFPVVARMDGSPSYQPDPGEVAEVIELPTSVFDQPERFWAEDWVGPGDEPARKVYFFRYGEHVIWGATAKILKGYLAWANRPDPWEIGLKS